MIYIIFFIFYVILAIIGITFLFFIAKLLVRIIIFLMRLTPILNGKSIAYERAATSILCIIFVALIGNEAYTAFYPGSDFYVAELEDVISRKWSGEAKVVAGSATYPDFHGDYCSFSRIAIGNQSYQRLLENLMKDRRFAAGSYGEISTGQLTASNLSPRRVINSYYRIDIRSDRHQEISFLKNDIENDTEIEIFNCVT